MQLNVWKLKKKLFRNINNDSPSAKIDSTGNLITTPSSIKKLYLETYSNRLAQRKILLEYEEVAREKVKLLELRLDFIAKRRTMPWKMMDLEKVIKMLKNNKAPDPKRMINELLKERYAGTDLKEAILVFFNKLKKEHTFSEFMCYPI